MDRYWEANSATQAPAVPASNAGGFPTDGSLPAAVAPTTPGAWWFHSITEELRHAIVALGASPDFTKTDQLATALLAALAHLAVSINYNDLIGKPAPLGFTPVQQGTGIGQLANTVKIGWDGNGLKATVDSVDEGRFVLEPELDEAASNLQNNLNAVNQSLQNQINGKQPAGDYLTSSSGVWMNTNLQPLTINGIGAVVFIVLAGDGSQSKPEGTLMALPGRPGTWISNTYNGPVGSSGDYWAVWTRIA